MPYAKKKYYKKKTYKRRAYFGKSNLYKNTTAKKQASQIYALNKKVNRVVNQIKPETTIIEKPLAIVTFTTTGTSGAPGVAEWHTMFSLYRQKLFNVPNAYVMNGRMLRPYNITLYGQFMNKNYDYITDYTSGGETGVVSTRTPLTGYLKFIFVKPKLGIALADLPTQITKSFEENVADVGLINGPLIENVSNYFNIMFTKTIKVNDSDPCKMFRVYLKKLKPFTEAPNEILQYDNGEIYVYVQYFCPVTLTSDNKQVAPIHSMKLYGKYAFVDEN